MPNLGRIRVVIVGAQLALAAACRLSLDGVDTHDAGGAAEDGDEQVFSDMSAADAASTKNELAPPLHASCRDRAVPPLPDPPVVMSDAVGRPTFDWWRDLTCDEVPALSACDDPFLDVARCPYCLHLAPGTPGVCATDASAACDYPNVPISFREGACNLCVPPALKAALCCSDHASSIECRSWPFNASSGPGDLCAVHEDCEAGLVCRGLDGQLFGRCTCPETTQVRDLESQADCLVGP